MKKFYVGQKVRFISSEMHLEMPRYYPAPGTIGTLVKVADDETALVQWPINETNGHGKWWTHFEWIEAVQETKPPIEKPNFDEFSPEVSRALKDLFSYVERVNVSRKRSIYIDYARTIPGMLCVQEWDNENRKFTVNENFHAKNKNYVEMIERAHMWLRVNIPANDRCGTHVYYARLSFRCPDVACLIRTTTRSALVAAKEIGEGAEIVEIQSLHGRVLDIAKKQPDGTYKRLK